MKIALVGNQNSGKTTLFNLLTGMNAKIGNWPGVTIEKKVGKIKGTNHKIIDLPGIYSLSPYTIEEEVSRNFIINEKPDAIINIIDATALERSLYLTTQLLELDCKVIVALNMSDLLNKKGLDLDEKSLSKELGTKVVKISALKETGIDELISSLEEKFVEEKKHIFDSSIEESIENIEKNLNKKQSHKKFIGVKLLEQDEGFSKYNNSKNSLVINNLKKNYDTDLEEVIATQRYSYIESVKKKCIKKKIMPEKTSDKLDKIFLNKYFAFPIFIIIMFLIYYFSVGVVGSFTVDFVADAVESFGNLVWNAFENYGVSNWLNSLVVDGMIAGVGAVLGFVPQLIMLFTSISILETTGYMSRISFLLDKMFRKIGLSGKSLIPFIVGSGCSVPGILSSRILENENERQMTAVLTPFIPCSAKLPIIALFSGYFFPENSGLISASLYFFSIVVIVLSALLIKKFIFKGATSSYVFELPEYKLPSFKYTIKDVYEKVMEFIKRAGSVILLCSIVLWFLLSFSFSMEYAVDIEKSMLAIIGNKISWIFEPILGVKSWGATVSAIQGLVAKEQVISSMAVINGLSSEVEEGSKIFLNSGIFGFFTQASAYAFMVFNLFSAPCFAAIGAMKKELGSTKKMLIAVAFQTAFAWILSTLVYQIGSRIGSISFNLADIIIIILLVMIIVLIIISKSKRKKNPCSCCSYSKSCNKNDSHKK